MIYLFIPLNTILFMAKFTMKTTTTSTTNIMLLLSLHPVITTKKRNEDWSSCSRDIQVYLEGTILSHFANKNEKEKLDRSRSVGHAIIQSTKKLDHWDLRINFGFHVYTHFGSQNASNNSISCLWPNRKWNYYVLKLVLGSLRSKDQLSFSCPYPF